MVSVAGWRRPTGVVARAVARACLPYGGCGARQSGPVANQRSRFETFSDQEWARVEALLPSNVGRRGHPFGKNRRVVEGIIWLFDMTRGEARRDLIFSLA